MSRLALSPSLGRADGPIYLGLYACLMLGAVCNCFLDIRYGHFAFETTAWGVIFAFTLCLGWRQDGTVEARARAWQKGVLVMAGLLFVLVFLPIWGLPRAGIYFLCGLQAAQNCVATTRRHFYFALLVSAVLVLFAAAHPRADWTMLFYLLPYVLAVVLTLVAEQVGRRSRQVQQQALGPGRAAGQGLAVVTAALAILGLASLFYALTPQPSWADLAWKHGLPGGVRWGGASAAGGSGEGTLGGVAVAPEAAAGPARSDWPSPEEMRLAAGRPGMPAWQAGAIRHLADWTAAVSQVVRPHVEAVDDGWERLKEWWRQHRQAIAQGLLLLLCLALLLAAWWLARETAPLAWLRTRLDYLRLGLWARHGDGREGARALYAAAERLLTYYGEPRAVAQGPREYGGYLSRRYPELGGEVQTLMGYFDQARYGPRPPQAAALQAMGAAYRRIFRVLTA